MSCYLVFCCYLIGLVLFLFSLGAPFFLKFFVTWGLPSCFSLFFYTFIFADRANPKWKSASWIWSKYMPQCVSVVGAFLLFFFIFFNLMRTMPGVLLYLYFFGSCFFFLKVVSLTFDHETPAIFGVKFSSTSFPLILKWWICFSNCTNLC